MHRFFAKVPAGLLLILSLIPELGATDPLPERVKGLPDIVFVMLDDMDVWDVGAYGSPDIVTETMDDLAAAGMRFTQYYAAGPVCSPTRVSLLTGHAPAHYGVKRAVTQLSNRGIPGKVVTLAALLHGAGYRTAHIGKWHVGTRKPQFLPPAKGFDESVRVAWERSPDYFDYTLSINGAVPIRDMESRHLTEVLTDHAIETVRKARTAQRRQPLFLNLWYFAPHRPLGQLPGDFDNSETRYCLTSAEQGEPCPSKRGELAALVTNADRQLGRLMKVLDENSARDTIVIVTSDNGGARGTHNSELIPMRTERGFKGEVYDGGIKVPLIIRWKNTIASGTVNDSFLVSYDFMPTLAEIAGVDTGGLALDGQSFLDTLRTNRPTYRKGAVYWENKVSNRSFVNSGGVFNRYAMRRGDWKLLFEPGFGEGRDDRLSLFNLATDPGEHTDLLADRKTWAYDVNLMGYRMKGSLRSKGDAQKGKLGKYDVLVGAMQGDYFAWRRRTGEIAYEIRGAAGEVLPRDASQRHIAAPVRLMADTRVDFNDGDFSFAATVTAADAGARAVIAEKMGSWKLFVEKDLLWLHVFGSRDVDVGRADSEILKLSSRFAAGSQHRIAFTLFGWKFGPTSVSLYLDGELVARSNPDDGPNAVRAASAPQDRTIYIGSQGDGDDVLNGTVSPPFLSALSMYPAEIWMDHVSSTGFAVAALPGSSDSGP